MVAGFLGMGGQMGPPEKKRGSRSATRIVHLPFDGGQEPAPDAGPAVGRQHGQVVNIQRGPYHCASGSWRSLAP